MNATGLPDTVVQVLGQRASEDLQTRLEAQLPGAQAAAEVQISAFVARQKVNVLMLEQVSNLLLAGEPALEQTPDGGWQWRVPVDLTFPSHGRVGRVGEIMVDARYGRVYYDDVLLARMAMEAERLAGRTLATKS